MPKLPPRITTILICLFAGLAAALAHPPFGFIPGLLAFGAMMRLGDAAPNLRSAFWRGWLVGLSYFALSCWWVAEAFFVDAETFGWMAPFAVFFLAGGLALFWGIALLVYRLIRPKGVVRVLVFAGVLAALEWVRGHIFTGFPWNLPGVAWGAGGMVSQTASLVGVYGLTWLTLAVCAAPAVLIDGWKKQIHWFAVGVAAVALIAMAGYGDHVLEGLKPTGRALAVRSVQPDIPQAVKYDQASFNSMVARYIALTAQPSKGLRPELIAWPEAALPYSADRFLSPGDPTRAAIAGALVPGQILLIGAVRFEGEKAFNTLVAVRREASDIAIIGVYDKYRLVPFGEYVPAFLAKVGFRHLAPIEDLASGPPPRPLDLGGGLIIQPLICYESLFPGFTRKGGRLTGKHAGLIVNISNDSWFGATSGPIQHLNQARFRAIEEGVPMMRATPTGVSAVIDSRGNIVGGAALAHGVRGVADGVVTVSNVARLNDVHDLTLYARNGDAAFLVMCLLSCLVAMIFRRKSAEST